MKSRSKLRSLLLLAVAALFVAGIAAATAIEPVRWRLQVIALHLAGKIPDITLKEVIVYMLPGSDQSMAWLVERRNPYAVIRDFKTSESDINAGSELFLARCASCHGPDASGGTLAPSLVGRELKHGDSDWAVYRTIRDGVPNTAMLATPDLTETQRWQLISFIRFINVPAHDREEQKVPSPLSSGIDVLAGQLSDAQRQCPSLLRARCIVGIAHQAGYRSLRQPAPVSQPSGDRNPHQAGVRS